MRIIGIDPGTLMTGIGIIECLPGSKDIKLIHYDCISQKPAENLPNRLKKIYDLCLECIRVFKPDEFAIETAFYGKNIQSTLKLGQARGVAIIAAVNHDLIISEYSPREVKKSVTGNGSSSKEHVRTIIKSLLKMDKEPDNIDSSDALAVAICHHFRLTNGINSKTNGKKKYDWKKYIEENPGKIIAAKQ
jgi:crossover junction endodeoxyribonuclease RuvC